MPSPEERLAPTSPYMTPVGGGLMPVLEKK